MPTRLSFKDRLHDVVGRFFRALLGLPPAWRAGLIVLSDIMLVALAAPIGYTLRVGALVMPIERFAYVASIAALAWLSIALVTGLYRIVLRYFGFDAVYRLGLQCALLALVLSTTLLVHAPFGTPRTMGAIMPMVIFLFTVTMRAGLSLVLLRVDGRRDQPRAHRRVLIFGARSAARALGQSVLADPTMKLVAFVDPDEKHVGRKIEGRDVWSMTMMPQELRRRPVDDLFIAARSSTNAARRQAVEWAREHNPDVQIRLLPSFGALAAGEVEIKDLRKIKVEDLLGRDMVAPRPELLATIAGRDVMVTGAGGSIGSELARQLVRLSPRRLVLVDQSEYALYAIEQELEAICAAEAIDVPRLSRLADLADAGTCDRLFAEVRPDKVYHAAAYKHVPLVESNVVAGVCNNVIATLNTVEAALRHGARDYLLVSTDKAVRPTNVMGASKRLCEIVVQHHARTATTTRFSAVRFGNVLGSSGSVVPRFERQIAEGGPITLTDRRINRFFMTIPEAALLVIQSGAMAKGGEIFLLDMGEPVRIEDLARSMVELAGLRVKDEEHPDGDIEIVEVGLRPGEKLFEELLIDADAVPTDHPRIVMAHEAGIDPARFVSLIDRLRAALDDHDSEGVVALLAEGVSGYRPCANGQRARLAANVDTPPCEHFSKAQ